MRVEALEHPDFPGVTVTLWVTDDGTFGVMRGATDEQAREIIETWAGPQPVNEWRRDIG